MGGGAFAHIIVGGGGAFAPEILGGGHVPPLPPPEYAPEHCQKYH